MKTLYLLGILLLMSDLAAGQNWQCIQPGKKIYFTNSAGYLRGMRIDSVTTLGSEVTYYPFKTPRGTYRNFSGQPVQLDTNGGSWLGSRIIQKQDGSTQFDNIWHDTLLINPIAAVGQSWVFYSDTTSRYYEAIVSGTDTMTIEESVDSIKKIDLQAKIAGVPVSDSLNGFQIILSKNNGFVQVPDLVTFPYHDVGSPFNIRMPAFFDYYLDMIRNRSENSTNYIFKRTTFHNLTPVEIYDYQPGDIFQYSEYNGLWSATHIGTTTDSIIARQMSGNLIKYTVQVGTARPYFIGNLLNYNYAAYLDTLIVNINEPLLVDTMKMPEEWYNPHMIYYNIADTILCTLSTRVTLNNTGILLGNGQVNTFEPLDKTLSVKAGFGSIYESRCDDPLICFEKKLIYSKKNSLPCGTSQALGIEKTALSTNLKIWPNPAHGQLFVALEGSEVMETISLNTLQGQLVTALKGPDKILQMDISGISPGLYILKVRTLNGLRNQLIRIE